MIKNLPASAGDEEGLGLIPGSGRSPRVGNGNLLQYSGLENSMDRGAWLATVRGVEKESDTTAHTYMHMLPEPRCLFPFPGWQSFQLLCFPGSLVGKESACNAGDLSLIPEPGRPPGERNGNLLQYSCLEN